MYAGLGYILIGGHQQRAICAANESDGHMLFPMDNEPDVQGLAQVMFGFFSIVELRPTGPQIVMGPDDIRVVLAEDFELDVQACLKALNCLDILAWTCPSHVVDGQIVEAKCSGRVSGSQSVLEDGQGLLEVLFGCVMLTQIAAGRPHVHQGGGRQAVSAAMVAVE